MKNIEKININETFSFAWSYVKKYPYRLTLACSWLIISSILEIITPLVSGKLIDFLSKNLERSDLVIEWLIFYLWIFMSIWIWFWTFRHCSWFLWAKVVAETMQKIVQDALFKVQRFSSQWHGNSFSWANVTKIKRWMRWCQRFIDLMYFNFIPLALVISGVVIIVILKYMMLWVIIAIWTILYAALSIYLSLKYVMPLSRIENKYDTLVWASLADCISCNATVKSFWSEKSEDNRLKKVINLFKNASLKSWKRSEYTNMIQNVFMTCYKWVFLFFAIYLWYLKIFSVWDVVYSLSSYHMISGHLRNIWNQIRDLQQSASDMEDIIIFSKLGFLIKNNDNAKALKITKWEIIFDNVNFKYSHQNQAIFKNLSITVKPWEHLAFVWHSWAGKSSLFSILQRLYDINSWSIYIDNQNIKDLTIESLRKNIVLIPQEPILFHRSLSENISYWKPGATKEEIIKAAKLAHAHEFIDSQAKKYETLVWERWIKLSGWERQRIAIARAILANKKILLLDEATSSLDSISEKYIQDSMQQLMKNKTTIIIAHRLSTIKKADRIIVLDKWKVTEQWNHSELLKMKWKYSKLWEHQAWGFIV